MPGTWGPLAHQPTFGAGTMLLLTDGTVMCQNSGTNQWWKLAPDINGTYVNGTWSALANGPNAPLYFASAVLRDGRVFVAGGEYNNGAQVELLAAEVYNPLTNTWTALSTPAGWTAIGDASSCVFPDGRIMLGSIFDSRCAIYDPVANTWTPAANKNNASSSEETWTLLPDQTILTVNCPGHPATQKYVIASNQWINCRNTPADLIEAASIEIGPAVLLPDGRLFAVGATNHTALYTMPPNSNQPGTWTNGPTFPPPSPGVMLGAKDAPGCLLPNGLVLCVAGPVDGVSGHYLNPTYFFEFNPATNTLSAITNPPTNAGPPYVGRFLLLPTGQVLFANGSTNIQVYTPTGAPDPMWKPNITSVPTSLVRGGTYTLYGRQINGLSQAVSYGDDAAMATNYPIVRLRNAASGHVFYCRTFNHSTLGVNTGTVIHHTQFTVPSSAELGLAEITVVANGIASDSVRVTVSAIKKLEIKEVKIEIKELKEIEAGPAPTGGSGAQTSAFDPDLLAAIKMLAERADQAAAETERQQAKQPFIQEDERPAVGETALGQLAPPSNPNKKAPE
ncbi:MAG: Kelch repeat-containing protein [Bryobacteraceae bacterium]